MDYIAIIFAGIWGYFFWHELPDIYSIIGFAFILSAILLSDLRNEESLINTYKDTIVLGLELGAQREEDIYKILKKILFDNREETENLGCEPFFPDFDTSLIFILQ